MAVDRTFVESNRAATERMRAMAALSDDELMTPVGQHWTVAVVLVHMAYWDSLSHYVLDMTEREGKLHVPPYHIYVNDLMLPVWLAVPPRKAGPVALAAAEGIDRRLESYPEELLQQVYDFRSRWVDRYQHRTEHMDEADAALGKR